MKKKLRASRKPRKCPKCGGRNVKTIKYGYPDPDAFADDRYLLGGCIVTEDDPRWACTDCNVEIYGDPPWSGGS